MHSYQVAEIDRARQLLERGEFARAVEEFERAAHASSPRHPARQRAERQALDARLELARAHVFAHRFVEAERELDVILSRDPGRLHAHWLRARLWERSGCPIEALEQLETLWRAGVHTVATSLLEASCHAARGDAAAFQAVMSRALALAQRRPAAPLADSRVPGLEAQEARAVDWFRRFRGAVSQRPRETGCRLLLAELLLDAGVPDEAELHLAVARTLDHDDVRTLALDGRVCLERGDAAGALQRFERVAQRMPGYADLWAWIGLAQFHARAFTPAIAALERSLERNRRYAGAWQALALVRFAAGDVRPAALATRQLSLRHRERSAHPGTFYRALAGQPDPEALRELHRAAALHPDYPDLEDALESALERQGRRRSRGPDGNGAPLGRADGNH